MAVIAHGDSLRTVASTLEGWRHRMGWL